MTESKRTISYTGVASPNYPTKHEFENLRASHTSLTKQVKDNRRDNRAWWMTVTARADRRFTKHSRVLTAIIIWQLALTGAVGYAILRLLGWL